MTTGFHKHVKDIDEGSVIMSGYLRCPIIKITTNKYRFVTHPNFKLFVSLEIVFVPSYES